MAGKWLVDLDGTLVKWDGVWRGPEHIGEPIQPMIDRVKMWLAQGRQVVIFTARAYPLGIDRFFVDMSDEAYEARVCEASKAVLAIKKWAVQTFGKELPVTCWKDYNAVEVWDDRAVQLIPNTGVPAVSSVNGPTNEEMFDRGYSAGFTSGYAEALDKYGIKQ